MSEPTTKLYQRTPFPGVPAVRRTALHRFRDCTAMAVTEVEAIICHDLVGAYAVDPVTQKVLAPVCARCERREKG